MSDQPSTSTVTTDSGVTKNSNNEQVKKSKNRRRRSRGKARKQGDNVKDNVNDNGKDVASTSLNVNNTPSKSTVLTEVPEKTSSPGTTFAREMDSLKSKVDLLCTMYQAYTMEKLVEATESATKSLYKLEDVENTLVQGCVPSRESKLKEEIRLYKEQLSSNKKEIAGLKNKVVKLESTIKEVNVKLQGQEVSSKIQSYVIEASNHGPDHLLFKGDGSIPRVRITAPLIEKYISLATSVLKFHSSLCLLLEDKSFFRSRIEEKLKDKIYKLRLVIPTLTNNAYVIQPDGHLMYKLRPHEPYITYENNHSSMSRFFLRNYTSCGSNVYIAEDGLNRYPELAQLIVNELARVVVIFGKARDIIDYNKSKRSLASVGK